MEAFRRTRRGLAHGANHIDVAVVRGSNASRGVADVRFLADFVRYTPVNGHSKQARQCPLIAKTGHGTLSLIPAAPPCAVRIR